MEWLYWLLGVVGVVVAIFLIWGAVLTLSQASKEKSALPSFFLQRERLEAQFFQAASHSGKPRGLRWKSCDWDDKGVVFAREGRTSGKAVFNLNPGEAMEHFKGQYERVEKS